MTTTSPKIISIITATWNDGNYLSECVNSVLAQSYRDWEWIIVNNGSSDNTEEILSQISDSRITIINLKENAGVSSGRNLALERANGSFICFLDGDDILPENSISARVKVFDKDQDIGFVDGKVLTFQGSVENVTSEYIPDFRGLPMDSLLSLDGSVFMGNTWMIRVEKPVKMRFENKLTHGEELLFYIRAMNGCKYDFTDEPVLHYRKHGTSAMSNIEGQRDSYVKIIAELRTIKKVTNNQIHRFRQKASSIIFKSFLKEGKPIKALFGAYKVRKA
ncbi:glycosyltransferase family 2 protein [Salibacteraceae bacterium]|jgi:glycosyltransferase involved in cell wall biosynthesis|nr:glycosyltransferase family 2 protein [Salibacteraceae bacterium]